MESKNRGVHIKTQISKPAGERSSYTKEYKQEALCLGRASGRGTRESRMQSYQLI
jgi:hypothetical protein